MASTGNLETHQEQQRKKPGPKPKKQVEAKPQSVSADGGTAAKKVATSSAAQKSAPKPKVDGADSGKTVSKKPATGQYTAEYQKQIETYLKQYNLHGKAGAMQLKTLMLGDPDNAAIYQEITKC